MRIPRWFAELGPARLVLAALALLAAGTAATAVAVPADTRRSDAWTVDSLVGKAPYPQRDLVLASPAYSNHAQYPNSAADIASVASANLAALPDTVNRLVAQTTITRRYDHPLPAVDPPSHPANPGWLRFDWSPQLGGKVRFVAGGAPGPEATQQTVDPATGFPNAMTMTLPIAVSQQAADRLGLTVGTLVKMNTAAPTDDRGPRFTLNVQVAGIFEPAAGTGPDDPMWNVADKPNPVLTPVCLGDNPCDPEITVWESDVFVGRPEAIATVSALSRLGEYTTTYDYSVDPARLTPAVLNSLGPALDRAQLGVGNFKASVTMNTGLSALARQILATQTASHQLAAVVLGALAAGALAALFLMLRLTVLRRARDVALCRARGASPVRLALRHATQTSAIVLGFAVLGAFGAVAAGRGTLRTPAAWSGVVLVTLLTFGAICYWVFRSGDRITSVRHEAIGETARGKRVVRDVGVLLAAGGALAVYRSQGSANTDGSIDWIAVAAPALLAFAAGIAAVRLVPLLFGPAVRLLGQSGSVVGFVAAALSGRRVRVVAAPLAGLVVVVAAGMFAAGYDASVKQKVRDDSLRTVGAVARIDVQPNELPDTFAAAAAKAPGVRGVFTGRADTGGIAPVTAEGVSEARSITVLTVDPRAFRQAAAAALADGSARGQTVPASWPAPKAGDGTVSVLASPSLAGLYPGKVSVTDAGGTVQAVISGFADVPLADSVESVGGADYIVVPADQVPDTLPGKPNFAWFSGTVGAIPASGLRTLPGVSSDSVVMTLGDVRSHAYSQGGVSAARDVFHLVEALCAGYFALCLLQLLTATRTVSRDSALLLQVFGLRPGRSRLVATLVPLPVAVLAAAAGIAMGAGLSPMLGPVDRGPGGASGDSVVAAGSIGWGWTVPVVVVVSLMTVGGVLLDQLLRRPLELSIRLRDAEFE